MLNLRNCSATELTRVPICCVVSIYHELPQKEKLSIEDLYGHKLMLIKRNWSKYVDMLRDDLWEYYPEIEIVDFSFYNIEVFNQCEHNNAVLMSVPQWKNVHPMLKIIPVDWKYEIPFGLLHSPTHSKTVEKFVYATKKAFTE